MADEAPKVRKCKEKYKDDQGNLLTCDTTIPKGQSECRNRKRHLHKFPTGFCAAGFHEGTKAKDASGKPTKVCEFWQSCNCPCHMTLDKMYALSGMPRVPVENPEYRRPHSEFWMPSAEDRAMMHVSSNSGVTDAPVVIESPIPEAIPASIRRDFTPTPTGRSGRGQLESWVKEACDEWIVEKYSWPCTPSWIAEWVQKNKGVGNQSQGAVNAVFERWTKLGFAVIEKKPTRFVRYTPDGIRLGLEVMKVQAKDKARRNPSPSEVLTRRS